MDRPLDLARVIQQDAASLKAAREKAMTVHQTDIRAAGNEVEDAVRDYFRRVLPQPYYVTSGHLIDSNHQVSSQIDVIIADASNLPSLYTTSDGTEYIPITSVYAIGEVKSTYYKPKRYFEEMKKALAKVLEMDRPLVENTAFGGTLRPSTTMRDIVLGSRNRFLNHLFSFLFCVDAGDFAFEDVTAHLKSTDLSLVPNVTVLLDKGIILRSKLNADGSLGLYRYPSEAPSPEYDWAFAENLTEGSSLAALYAMLIAHLTDSHLEPANAYSYTDKLRTFRRSTLRWAKDTPAELSSG